MGMDRTRFAGALQKIITDSGYQLREVELEIYKRYGSNVQVTRDDLFVYLSGDRTPRADKLMAICDVCNVSGKDMAFLVASFRPPDDVATSNQS